MENTAISIGELTENEAMALIGGDDRNLKVLSEYFDVPIVFRDHTFILKEATQDQADKIKHVLETLNELAKKGQHVQEQDVIYACRMADRNELVSFETFSQYVIGRTLSGKQIAPKTKGQLRFVKAMRQNDIVFAIGPAGTGKTYLAVVNAVTALRKGDVKRILLTRPAVEAGESLGFLPGDLKEKVDPYLTPLYDALYDMLGAEQTERLIEKGTVEIAPLAYMRGRTLDDSYIILDEAQNTTKAQMKMFLTRLGFRSHMVITGDITQIDLKPGVISGLNDATNKLADMDEISIIHLDSNDVVRHPLVQKIIERYDEESSRN